VAGDITERLAISFNGSRYDELVTFKAQLEQASRVHLEPNTVRAASGRGGITSELEQVRAELQEQACAGTAGKCWVRLLEPNATVTQGDSCFGSWEIRRSLAHGATVDEPPYISAGAISLSETHHLSQCRLSEPLVVALYVNVTVDHGALPEGTDNAFAYGLAVVAAPLAASAVVASLTSTLGVTYSAITKLFTESTPGVLLFPPPGPAPSRAPPVASGGISQGALTGILLFVCLSLALCAAVVFGVLVHRGHCGKCCSDGAAGPEFVVEPHKVPPGGKYIGTTPRQHPGDSGPSSAFASPRTPKSAVGSKTQLSPSERMPKLPLRKMSKLPREPTNAGRSTPRAC